MKRLAIALVTGTLMTAPAFAQQNAQQNQGGSSVGNILENMGRQLNGQGNPQGENESPGAARQQTYGSSEQQYRNASDQQLQLDRQRLDEAQARLQAASEALDQEMSRRGMQTGYNQNRTSPGAGNYSGSSTDQGYRTRSAPGQSYGGTGDTSNAPGVGPGGSSYGR